MISMDSLDAAFLCPRCGCAAFHSNCRECIGALRQHIAELEFKRTNPSGQARHRRDANTPGRYADAAIPRFIAGCARSPPKP
jgi:hypothetical protein